MGTEARLAPRAEGRVGKEPRVVIGVGGRGDAGGVTPSRSHPPLSPWLLLSSLFAVSQRMISHAVTPPRVTMPGSPLPAPSLVQALAPALALALVPVSVVVSMLIQLVAEALVVVSMVVAESVVVVPDAVAML